MTVCLHSIVNKKRISWAKEVIATKQICLFLKNHNAGPYSLMFWLLLPQQPLQPTWVRPIYLIYMTEKVKVIERHAFGTDCHWNGNIFAFICRMGTFLPEVLRFFMFSRIRKDLHMVTQPKVPFLETGKCDIKLLCGPNPALDDIHLNSLNKGGRHHLFVTGKGMRLKEAKSQTVLVSQLRSAPRPCFFYSLLTPK